MMLSGLPLYWREVSGALALVGANRQSNLRSTVSGRMTLRYSLRLYGPRSRLQMLQMSLASWWWGSVFIQSFRVLYFSGSVAVFGAAALPQHHIELGGQCHRLDFAHVLLQRHQTVALHHPQGPRQVRHLAPGQLGQLGQRLGPLGTDDA